MDAVRYYQDHLKEINEAISIICRKHGMSCDEEKDFAQHVHLQLVEDDYRKLRAYEGRSSLKTYLHTVISRIFIDQVRSKWHPSTEAKRMGATAVELEKLVYQHQYALHEACQILAGNPATVIDENAAHEMLTKLTVRRPRPAAVDDPDEYLPGVPDHAPDPEQLIINRQLQQKKQKMTVIIANIIGSLSDDDRLLVKLQFISGHRVSEISRLLGIDDRLLYRRTQTILRNMRKAMADAGIGEGDVWDMLGNPGESDD